MATATASRVNATQLTPEEAYEKYRLLIYKQVHSFIRQKGGEFDELLSHAHFAFMKAYHKYEVLGERPKTGNWCFGGYLKKSIWNWLKEYHRRGLKRELYKVPASKVKAAASWKKAIDRDALTGAINFNTLAARESFDLPRLRKEVSKDAETVLKVALKVPGRQGNRQRALIDFFQDLGWAGKRILESFREIKEALAS